jgi:hypothetical protein
MRYEHTFTVSGDLLQHEVIARGLYCRLHPEAVRMTRLPLRYGAHIHPGRQKGDFFPYCDDTHASAERTDLLQVSYDAHTTPGVILIESTVLTAEYVRNVATS